LSIIAATVYPDPTSRAIRAQQTPSRRHRLQQPAGQRLARRRQAGAVESAIRDILMRFHQAIAWSVIPIIKSAIRQLPGHRMRRDVCGFGYLIRRHVRLDHNGKQRLAVLQRQCIVDASEWHQATLQRLQRGAVNAV
jgi:hypothetical protein